MKPFCTSDSETFCEIEKINKKRVQLMELAYEKETSHQLLDALELYTEAQHLSFHVGEGLKVKIVNELQDFKNWHWVNKKINSIENILF